MAPRPSAMTVKQIHPCVMYFKTDRPPDKAWLRTVRFVQNRKRIWMKRTAHSLHTAMLCLEADQS